MGYSTTFEGYVSISPPLSPPERAFLKDLAETRRMDRTQGPLFVNGGGEFGEAQSPDIVDYNRPPADQPGLWCQWAPSEDGTKLVWDEGEKFYRAADWMLYIVSKLLSPDAADYIKAHKHEDPRLKSFTCNHTVNGVITAQGDDDSDRWDLVVVDNSVSARTSEGATPR